VRDWAYRWNHVFDWLYHHHAVLSAVLAVAVIALLGAITLWRRRSAWIGFGFGVAPFLLVVAVIAGWVLGDQWSLAGDIDQSVHEVTAAFPDSARRTAVRTGDNFRTELYLVPQRDAAAVAAEVRRSVLAQLRPRGRVYLDPRPPTLLVLFDGGEGCEGTIEVPVDVTSRPGGAVIDVKGYCED
jgi:hypothetical protein